MTQPESRYRTLDQLEALDLDNIRLVLRGHSVIDWSRVEFRTAADVNEFLRGHEFDLDDPASRARSEAIKNAAIGYLRRNFDFPIPRPVAEADIGELLLIASSRGHRQLCACTILKVVHIIHHLEARELLYMLPISDQEVFLLVEQKVRRVIGAMMARGLPIVEFVGGRKNKDALYSKLLSKKETHAAQIYDKLRFRVVTRDKDDIWPVLGYLTRNLFPFNYVVPGEATNTLFDFRTFASSQPHLTAVARTLQPLADERGGENDNIFSAPSYRVVHFVCDLPVPLPQEILEAAPPAAWSLGRVVFAQAEFQIIDRDTEQANELGDASHDAYKARQRDAVTRRLKLGSAFAERWEERERNGRSPLGNVERLTARVEDLPAPQRASSTEQKPRATETRRVTETKAKPRATPKAPLEGRSTTRPARATPTPHAVVAPRPPARANRPNNKPVVPKRHRRR